MLGIGNCHSNIVNQVYVRKSAFKIPIVLILVARLVIPDLHRVLVGAGRVYWVLAVLDHQRRHSLLNEVVMVRAEEPAVRVVIVKKDIAPLLGGGMLVRLKALEGERTLLEIDLTVASLEESLALRKHWQQRSARLFDIIYDTLTEEE